MTLLKACNVRSPEDLEVLLSERVNIAGIRALAQGRGSLPLPIISEIIKEVPRESLQIAILTDRLDLERFAEELKIGSPDMLILHSRHDESTIELARKVFPKSSVGSLLAYEDSVDEIERMITRGADFYVCDWLAGGTGKRYNQRVLDYLHRLHPSLRLMIAGGITSLNVEDVVRNYRPFGIDVDSGVRSGPLNQFDKHLLRAFVSRIEKVVENRSDKTEPIIPFKHVYSPPWSSLRSTIVDGENIVAKTRLLSKLDAIDRYRNSRESFIKRVSRSLGQLASHPDVSDRWVESALCAFAATTYLPNELLRSSIRYLYMRVCKHILDEGDPNVAFHVFSNDPGALAEDFFRINEIQGRLDQDKFVRIDGVEQLGRALIDAGMPESPLHDQAIQRLGMLTERKVWVVLVDQTLSGHSLLSDLERIAWFNDQVRVHLGRSAKIVVCAQIATKTALLAVRRSQALNALLRDGSLAIEYAIGLGHEYNLSDRRCNLISDGTIRKDLLELCSWFAEEFIADDEDLARMRRKSGDHLPFGYRSAGLLLARQDNCPTDSIPILWYVGKGRGNFDYTGPFPRVHSRIGEQTIEQTSDTWKSLIGANKQPWLEELGKFI